MSALAHLTSQGLHAQVQDGRLIVGPKDKLNNELRAWIRKHKPELLQALQTRWNPELSAQGYVWCLDCQYFNNSCTHPENPFRIQQPLVPRKCHWFANKTEKSDAL